MKVLSIAVPVYNTEKYIQRCIDSMIVEEIMEHIEIILVNDGSRDKSLEIMNKYKQKYPQSIVVIDKPNGGHGSTINAALKVATGKYFRVLDSDDWVNSADFVKFVEKLKDEDVDLVLTDYKKEHIYNGLSEKFYWNELKQDKIYIFDNIDLTLLEGNYFVMANSTYKTEILKKAKLNLLEKTFYVDMQYNIVPILYVKTIKFIKLDIYRYFIGRPDQSMNLDNFVKNRENHERVMKFLIEYYNQNLKLFSENQRKYVRQILFYMLTTHYYIFCVYAKSDRAKMYKEVKEFDYYLKNTNKELYVLMNDIGQIRCNRMTNFIFVKINPQLFSKVVSKCGSIIKKGEE